MTDEGKENLIQEESEETTTEIENKDENETVEENEAEEDVNEEMVEDEDVSESDSSKSDKNDEFVNNTGVPFFQNLGALIIDQCLIGVVSLGALYLFNFIIKLDFIGYQVNDRVSVYLIIYIALNLLYPAIIEQTKLGATLGKKVCGLKTFSI